MTDIRVAAEQARVALQDAWVEQRAWLDDRDLPHDGCVLLPKINAALASLEAALAAQPEQQQGLVAASPAAAAQQPMKREWLDAAAEACKGSAAAAGVPTGWKLVPVEPTWEMERAGQESEGRSTGKLMESPGLIYKSMLAASPVAPVGAPTEEREAFEAHVLSLGSSREALLRRDFPDSRDYGEYVDVAVQIAWDAWNARALLSRPGCELATDATKQLREHSVHLAVPQHLEDFRMRPASSEAAPSAEWRPIETAPKDGRTIRLGFMEGGEITQTADMQWSHIQRNGLFPGAVGMWVCPGGNFTWNPEPAEFGPSHWMPIEEQK